LRRDAGLLEKAGVANAVHCDGNDVNIQVRQMQTRGRRHRIG